MSTLKLILTQEVTGLGSSGDTVEVKGGYGRNYLLPRGLAIKATRGAEKQVESLRRARATRIAHRATVRRAPVCERPRSEIARAQVPLAHAPPARSTGSKTSAAMLHANRWWLRHTTERLPMMPHQCVAPPRTSRAARPATLATTANRAACAAAAQPHA